MKAEAATKTEEEENSWQATIIDKEEKLLTHKSIWREEKIVRHWSLLLWRMKQGRRILLP